MGNNLVKAFSKELRNLGQPEKYSSVMWCTKNSLGTIRDLDTSSNSSIPLFT